MDSACILACGIEKMCSQYDENLFADHGRANLKLRLGGGGGRGGGDSVG